jgi:hypothetical protein
MSIRLSKTLTLVVLLVSALALVGSAILASRIYRGTRTENYGDALSLVDLAKVDLVERLGIGSDEIIVQSIEPAEFPDASMGVPKPGKVYAQVITPGYIIKLAAGGVVYEYHGSGDRVVLSPSEGNGTIGSITITSVQVVSGRVVFAGRSTLPSGICIQTQLLADDDYEAWWPADTCAAVQDGTWQIVVSLGAGKAPSELDSSAQYMLRAWQQDDPTIEAVFWFDLTGPPGDEQGAYRRVEIPDVGLVLEVPSDWQRLDPEWVWFPDDTGDLRIGIKWADIQPPMEPEAMMLPNHSQTLQSEPVELDWGNGRRFTVEVYGPAIQGGDTQAPVQSVETHILVIASQGDARRAFDFYASGRTTEQITSLEPALQRVLDSATLTW